MGKPKKPPRAPGVRRYAYAAACGLPITNYTLDWKKVREVARLVAETSLSIQAACGRADVTWTSLKRWMDDEPKVLEYIQNAKLKRLANLEEGLLQPDAKMPQVTARIFALKNADPEIWRDNPLNGPIAPGLHANITVITGVPEAKLSKTIEHQQNEPMAVLPAREAESVER